MARPGNTTGGKVRSLRELPQSIEPARDLWPGIESQLGVGGADSSASKRPGARTGPLRWVAAAMLACIAVGVWIGRNLLPSGPGLAGVPVTAANRPGVPVLARTAFDAAYVSDPRYERQRAELVRALQDRLAALPPPARAKVSASLGSIEKAKGDLQQALGHDPGNALLQELLIDTYQDEMRVLTDVHDASDAGRGI